MLRGLAVGAALLIASGIVGGCGGPGGPLIDPNSGRISGDIAIVGPYDPAAQLRLGLRFHQTGGGVEQSEVPVGRVPGAASAFFSGRSIRFTYTELFVNPYVVEVFSGTGAARRVWYTSLAVQPGTNGQIATSNGSFSFTGPGPYGSAAGTVSLAGDWPSDRNVFLGFTRVGGDGTLLRWPVAEADAAAGELPFEVGGLAFGDYELGLYSAASQGAPALHGSRVELLRPRVATPDLTGQDFAADFGAVLN